ncbi:hypothetical protein E6H24_00315 [Candidatus Bathyarchaeota archaeon]|nr:MAG: hypothetical protein E6H24_00315 [Candidatus Bathyarchaeota archaeon]
MTKTTFIAKSSPAGLQVRKLEQTAKPTEAPKPKNRTMVLAGIIVVILVVVGVGVYILTLPPSTPPPTGTPVSIWDTNGLCSSASNCGFKDASGSPNITITVGTTIIWTNDGKATHTTTSCDPTHASTAGCPAGSTSTEVWDSSIINLGGKYSHTFNTKGTFDYYCDLHAPYMHGQVVVQ